MIHLHVWLRPPKGPPQRVGEMLVSDPDTSRGGRMRGEFRYTQEFLDQSEAFPLDPLHLPLGPDPISAENPETGVHAVFGDSLPDAWGRAMMCLVHSVPRHKHRAAYLLELLGTEAMGALAYTPSARWVNAADMAELPDLADLAAAADRYEKDPDAPMDEMMRLFKAGSSLGGARPKVLINDNGTYWMAKLPSIKDTFDIVRLEAATLATAHNAGIDVPEFKVLDLGVRSALLIRRFDVTEDDGRNHVLSMKTLLGAENFYYLGYGDMADIVRQVSDEPGRDLKMLFRQGVLNALISNTDDHLKNFSMRRSARGWHLTQAYDLLPDIGDNREHVLHFGTAGTIPTMDSLYHLGKVFGLSARVTQSIVDEVREAVEGFSTQCEAYAVPSRDIEILLNRMLLLKKYHLKQ